MNTLISHANVDKHSIYSNSLRH